FLARRLGDHGRHESAVAILELFACYAPEHEVYRGEVRAAELALPIHLDNSLRSSADEVAVELRNHGTAASGLPIVVAGALGLMAGDQDCGTARKQVNEAPETLRVVELLYVVVFVDALRKRDTGVDDHERILVGLGGLENVVRYFRELEPAVNEIDLR